LNHAAVRLEDRIQRQEKRKPADQLPTVIVRKNSESAEKALAIVTNEAGNKSLAIVPARHWGRTWVGGCERELSPLTRKLRAGIELAQASFDKQLSELQDRLQVHGSYRRLLRRLFVAFIPVVGIFRPSLFISATRRTIILTSSIAGTIAIDALLFLKLGHVLRADASTKCTRDSAFDSDFVIRSVAATSMVDGLWASRYEILVFHALASVCGYLSSLLQLRAQRRGLWYIRVRGQTQVRIYLTFVRLQDMLIVTIGLLYTGASIVFVSAFLANVSEFDAQRWVVAASVSMLQVFVGVPLFSAICIAAVTHLAVQKRGCNEQTITYLRSRRGWDQVFEQSDQPVTFDPVEPFKIENEPISSADDDVDSIVPRHGLFNVSVPANARSKRDLPGDAADDLAGHEGHCKNWCFCCSPRRPTSPVYKWTEDGAAWAVENEMDDAREGALVGAWHVRTIIHRLGYTLERLVETHKVEKLGTTAPKKACSIL